MILFLLGMAQREAARRGRRAIGCVILPAGAAVVCFFLALSEDNPVVANACFAATVVCIAAAIGIVLWQGFHHGKG